MLGSDVDHILVLVENRPAVADEAAVGGQLETVGRIARHLVAHAQRVERRIIVLAQGVAHPVVAQEQPSHVGMVQEADAEVVVRLALVEFRSTPQVADRRQHGMLPVRSLCPQDQILARTGCLEVVDHTEPLLAPVHTRQAAQEVETFGLQPFGQRMQALCRHGEHPVAGIVPHGRGFPDRDLLFQGRIHRFSSLSTFNSFFSAVRSRLSSSSYSFSLIWRFTPPKKRCRRTLR